MQAVVGGSWKEPQSSHPLHRPGSIKKGLKCSGKTYWFPTGSSTRAVVRHGGRQEVMWSESTLGSRESREIPVNTDGFGNVAVSTQLSSRKKTPQGYIPIYPIHLDMHKNTSY